MKQIVLILSLILALAARADIQSFVIVDATDMSPIAGATVIGKTGFIDGLTDRDGRIAVDAEREIPFTVRCVGYDPISVCERADTVVMTPTVHKLSEVVVNPADKPVTKVICFAREYSSGITGCDTLQLYCEYMLVAFLTDEKVKGYKSSDARPMRKGAKRYARIVKDGRDSVFRPDADDDIAMLSWLELLAALPDEKINVPQSLMNGAETDSVPGKYGPKQIYRKKNNMFSITADVLSDKKNHKWSPWLLKLLGMTIDVDEASCTMSFADNGTDSVGIYDFICGTYNLHMLGRGKWIKKAFDSKQPIDMDTYLEIYPVDISHCTIDEYKQEKEDNTTMIFQYPADIKPLSPTITAMFDRISTASESR